MDPFLFLAVFIIFAVILSLSFVLYKFISKGGAPDDGEVVRRAPPAAAAAPVMAGGVRRRAPRNRMQMQDASDDENEEELFDSIAQPDGKVGTKKMKKLQDKEEKRREREAMLAEREERKERDKLLEDQRQKREAEEEAEQHAKEEEERKKKEEEERREHEEYLKLKEQFSVEEEGEEALTEQEGESLLQEFINYIQTMKVVMMEDLAGHFKLRTQDCVSRVRTLVEEERLSGVLDDRGKFIHITPAEYDAVAKFIKQRGRVSISELAESSNKLIELSPDNLLTHRQLVGSTS